MKPQGKLLGLLQVMAKVDDTHAKENDMEPDRVTLHSPYFRGYTSSLLVDIIVIAKWTECV